jgi:chemotaxis protein methyltransferase CheR
MTTLTRENLSESDFRLISDMVYRHCGIHLHEGKRELVQARLAKRLRTGGFTRLQDYLDHVAADGSGREFTALIDAMSTNLTSFFREIGHFHFLTEHFLPRLLERKRKQKDQRIRLWSAGCSTGEEPYSLAMTMLEAANPQEWDVKILATDISTRVLQTAKAGIYPKDRADSVPQPHRSKYFLSAQVGGERALQVCPAARSLICFRHLNLMENWPFTGPLDFIFCRNVMIYFDKPTQERLVGRFWNCLESGGLLFTGHSESLTGIRHKFSYVQPTIYCKP